MFVVGLIVVAVTLYSVYLMQMSCQDDKMMSRRLKHGEGKIWGCAGHLLSVTRLFLTSLTLVYYLSI